MSWTGFLYSNTWSTDWCSTLGVCCRSSDKEIYASL